MSYYLFAQQVYFHVPDDDVDDGINFDEDLSLFLLMYRNECTSGTVESSHGH